VRLRLSDTSFRLPPRQSRFVFYEAHADASRPAWFVLFANLRGFPARNFNGVNVQLELPHIVYLLPKGRWQEGDVHVVDATYDRNVRSVSVLVENRGSWFGRVAAVTVHGPGESVTLPGFPLFPGGRRRIHLEWKHQGEPGSVMVDARAFSFEHAFSDIR
jgi:hypothetical protein